MIQTAADLIDYIRKTVPLPKAIINLRVQASGAVFIWQGVEFLVKQTLEVFEVRGNGIYITGLSLLLQTALVRGNQEGHRFESMLTALGEAEDLARTQNQPVKAAQKLKAVREHLRTMVPKAGWEPGQIVLR